MIGSISGKFQLVHNLYRAYNPADPEHSTLTAMQPEQGYMIYMHE